MRILIFLLAAGITTLRAETAPPAELDGLFDPAGNLWQHPANEFIAAHRDLGFRWTSAQQDTARTARPELRFQGLPVYEALARFQGGRLQEVVISIYNRGDAGEVDDVFFQRLLQAAEQRLDQWTGMKGVTLRTQERTTSATIRRKAWVTEPYRVDLVWSYSEKSRHQGVPALLPEYARVQVTRFDPLQDPRKTILATGASGAPKPVSLMELRGRVQRLPNGDVLIPTVPMVDQGVKGYCAAAVAERVLRYYGRHLDQHEIAQLARSDAGGGTNPDQLVAALRRIGDETKMDVTTLISFDVREFEKTVTDYNRAAKRAKKPEVNFAQRAGQTLIVDSPVTVYQAMDTELLREARLKREAGLQAFKQTVTKFIQQGAPLAWGCVVGKVPETPALRGSGGHLRLIIGFNERTQEILFSDTWGAGHESKRMEVADAWMITLGLYSIQPRDLRF
jgi:hypothetical protein